MSSSSSSVLQALCQRLPHLRPQLYFKASLTALSHAMEDAVLAGSRQPLVIACFQKEKFYRQEARRYQRIAQITDQVYILAAPESEFGSSEFPYHIALDEADELTQEWHLVILDQDYSACLICRESKQIDNSSLDSMRQFKGIWTFDREVCVAAAELLLERILAYQPELISQVERAQHQYDLSQTLLAQKTLDLDRLFADRLLTYLQANQFKLLKAYKDSERFNQQLESLERSQRNLIAIVGHELRTPLSTIQVCLETFALVPAIPPALQEMLQLALDDSDRLRRLIQDFFRLSRLESGLVRWQIEPLALQDCLNPVLARLKSSTKPLPKIGLDLPASLPFVEVDREGLTDVFSKLLDNACKFTTPEGRVAISAQVQQLEPNRSVLEVKIADTGRGIEPTQLSAIFDRFYQEEGFLQRTIGGTGLGLGICRQTIQQLSGEIWAVSTGKNQGSQFYFTVPISLGNVA
ncbi:MAG: ATP-binding protein [Leptolyngbya sp. Prado105]|jgi:DICT domain-containing protein|nr:ATP-binding protein [Leptolyngbya sp. Prado105]